ncbi:MAG: hypothetical protein R3A44_12765 [Caldilineaceae bacterium]
MSPGRSPAAAFRISGFHIIQAPPDVGSLFSSPVSHSPPGGE